MSDSTFAVFSDIHSNLEALQAVLADIAEQGIHRMMCLGDVVGYAANPSKCLNQVRDLGCPVLRGNHDAAAAWNYALVHMRDVAKRGIEFSRLKLSASQRAYLAELPLVFTDGVHEFVHASLYAPSDWRYIQNGVEALMHLTEQRCRLSFCGHTHVPGMWHLSGTGNLKQWRGYGRLPLAPGGKTLINVGSVGQPRDGSPAACYVICDPEADCIEFRRVDYDIAKTRRKIMRAKLPAFVGERLSRGE